MKVRKILMVCLSILLICLVGCSCTKPAMTSSVNSKPSINNICAKGNKVAVKYYGIDENVDAYVINGNVYLDINDLSNLFRTKASYDKSNNTISIGDNTRASAVFYMPDLSAYPNLDNVIDLPPYEICTDGGTVDFKFLTKNILFKDMIKKIEKKLKSDGFTIVTKGQYSELTKSLSAFKKGKIENTYIKYGKKFKDCAEQFSIQIINGGLDKNKIPIIIVKMAG